MYNILNKDEEEDTAINFLRDIMENWKILSSQINHKVGVSRDRSPIKF